MRPFTYVKAATAADAVRAITAAGPAARFLAGGTTLYDLMKLNVEAPASIIDVNSLAELRDFDTSGSSELASTDDTVCSTLSCSNLSVLSRS